MSWLTEEIEWCTKQAYHEGYSAFFENDGLNPGSPYFVASQLSEAWQNGYLEAEQDKVVFCIPFNIDREAQATGEAQNEPPN